LTAVTTPEHWLDALWPVVQRHLPVPPAQVVEIGCGPLGGFVPKLRDSGYAAIGIDPEAPAEASYLRLEFERAELPERIDAVVACASLHHVADPVVAIDRIAETLAQGGALIVIEWDWTEFDAPTARWCFERLDADHADHWLHRLRDEWVDSEKAWDTYLREWAEREGVHAGHELLRLFDQRFDRVLLARSPYFFPNLVGTSEADERDAIDAGAIRATRIDYVGRAAKA
jgi:SAM-dependent methyltransferase